MPSYQVLDVASLSKYKPDQYTTLGSGVVLKEGVIPITGTTKEVQLATFINPQTGKREAAAVGSDYANNILPSKGYVLEGTTVGKPAVRKPTTQETGGATTRVGMEAKGFTYIGSFEERDKAIHEGKDVVIDSVSGSYYIAPKTGVQSTETARTQLSGAGAFGEVEQFAGEEQPKPPSLLQTYQELQKTFGMEGLQSSLADLDKQLKGIDDAYLAGQHRIEGQLAPTEILQGRARELQKQYTEQRATVLREREDVANRLQMKQATIENIMSLTDKDYQNARADYNDRFSQAIQLQNLYLTKEQAALSRQNAVRDEARANLSVLTNLIAESATTWDKVSPQMKSQISQLEVSAGLPARSIETFMTTKPKANLLATINGTDASGNDIVTFIYADENGNPGMVKTLRTGGFSPRSTGGSSSLSLAEQKYLIEQDYNASLASLADNIVTGGSEGSPESLLRRSDKIWYTREQAANILASQYNMNLATVKKDIYDAYPDSYRQFGEYIEP